MEGSDRSSRGRGTGKRSRDRQAAGSRSRGKRRNGIRAADLWKPPFLLLYALVFLLSVWAGYEYIAIWHNTGTVSAEAASTGGVRITQNCNIREAPGTDSPVIGGGSEGTVYEYAGRTETTGEDSLWYSIYYEDTVGWVSEAVASFRPDGA